MTLRGRLTRRELAALTAAGFVAWIGRRAGAQDPPPKSDPPTSPPGEAPPVRPPSAVDLALGWLDRHQGEDGRWSARDFAARCEKPPCDGAGTAYPTLGTTALGLLPFLAAGESHQSGEHKDTIKNAAKLIRLLRNEDGGIGTRLDPRWFEDHLAAAATVVELYGLTQSELFREYAREAVRFAEAQRRPDGGWGPGEGESESDVTARVAILLRLAAMAGIANDDVMRASALDYILRATDPRTGALRSRAPRAGEKSAPPEPEDAGRTALGAVARVFGAKDDAAARADKVVHQVADRLAKTPPAPWDKGGAESLVAWERQSTLFAQTRAESHLAWNRELERILTAAQRKDGCARGSWDPKGPGTEAGGRVAATALAALALAWPYRYASRLVPKQDPPKRVDPPPDTEPAPPK